MAVDMRAFLTGLSSGGVSIEKSNTLSAPPEKSATYHEPIAHTPPATLPLSVSPGGPTATAAGCAASRHRSLRFIPSRPPIRSMAGHSGPMSAAGLAGNRQTCPRRSGGDAVRLRQPTQDARGVPVWRHRRNGPPDCARLRCGGVGRYSGPRQGEASTRAPTGLRRDVKLGKAELRKRARFCGSNKNKNRLLD